MVICYVEVEVDNMLCRSGQYSGISEIQKIDYTYIVNMFLFTNMFPGENHPSILCSANGDVSSANGVSPPSLTIRVYGLQPATVIMLGTDM